MNEHKRLKPNLIDPNLKQRIIKTIKPNKDYWKPTKNVLEHIYEDYIKPNFVWVIVIFIFIMILIYRYRLTQKKRIYQDINPQTNSDIALLLYNHQKESLREPYIHKPKKSHSYPVYPSNGGRFDIAKSVSG